MRTITLLILWLSAAVAAAQSTAPQITIPRGDRLTLRFPCQYPDGSAVNVSNWTLEASIRASLTGSAVTNYTETAGAGGTNGYLTWSWDVGLAPGRYLLGFRWTTADGIVFTPLPRAPFMVLPSLLSPTNGEAVAGAPPSTRGDPREWIFTSTVSPTAGSVQSLAVNVGLRGPTGATGPQGDPASTNGLVAEAALGLLAWSNAVPWSLVEGEPTFLTPADTNGYASLSDLGTLAWSNAVPWALVDGEPTFLTPDDTNTFVSLASLGPLAFSNTVSWSSIDGEPTFLVPGDTNGNWGYATTQIYQPGTLGPFSDAPASASLQSYNGGSGETYYDSGYDHAIRVHAYRTNFAGTKYYATAYAQSDTVNDGSGESENYTLTWQWGAVAGAHGYLVLKSDTYSGYAYDYGIETTSTSWEDAGTGFSALTATPTTAITSNLITVPTLQTAVLHGTVFRGTTDVSQAFFSGFIAPTDAPEAYGLNTVVLRPGGTPGRNIATNWQGALDQVFTNFGVPSWTNGVRLYVDGSMRQAQGSWATKSYLTNVTIEFAPHVEIVSDCTAGGNSPAITLAHCDGLTIKGNGAKIRLYSSDGNDYKFLLALNYQTNLLMDGLHCIADPSGIPVFLDYPLGNNTFVNCIFEEQRSANVAASQPAYPIYYSPQGGSVQFLNCTFSATLERDSNGLALNCGTSGSGVLYLRDCRVYRRLTTAEDCFIFWPGGQSGGGRQLWIDRCTMVRLITTNGGAATNAVLLGRNSAEAAAGAGDFIAMDSIFSTTGGVFAGEIAVSRITNLLDVRNTTTNVLPIPPTINRRTY